MKLDEGEKATEQELAKIKKILMKVYKKATKEVKEKLDDYLRRFAVKDKIWREKVSRGEQKKEAWQAWRKSQIFMGERWGALKNVIASVLHEVNVDARQTIIGGMPTVYAENHNYATFEVEKAGRVDTSYLLYNADAVIRLVEKEPQILQPPGVQMKKTFAEWDAFRKGDTTNLPKQKKKAFERLIANGKDLRWQKSKIQSVAMQGILQGESIPNLSKRIAREMGEINHKSTVKYARTAMTAAQNGGRNDALQRASERGVKLQRRWSSVLDLRTRHDHRLLDGQIRAIDEPFEAEGETIMYPGDPNASPHMVWNCRCRLSAVVEGYESRARGLRSNAAIGGMSYDDWKKGHGTAKDILAQEKTAEIMKRKYIRELYS